MKTIKRYLITPLLLALAIGLIALPAGAAEKQLRIGMWSAPSSFSPISNPSGYGDAAIHLIYDALVDHSDTFEYVPGLARSWSVQEGNTLFVFELHPDARWHDGEPVTADDVVFTYAVNAHPDTVSVNGQALNVIQGTGPDGKALPGQAFGVQKIDERTVAIRTKFPMAEDVFMTRVASKVHIVPKHVLGSVPPASSIGTRPISDRRSAADRSGLSSTGPISMSSLRNTRHTTKELPRSTGSSW